MPINAYFLGKDVSRIDKSAVFGRQIDLMNRLIHRSWGESFVNIFLDLCKEILHFHPQDETWDRHAVRDLDRRVLHLNRHVTHARV